MSQKSEIRVRGTTSANGDKRSKGMKWKVTWWTNQGVDKKSNEIQVKGRKSRNNEGFGGGAKCRLPSPLGGPCYGSRLLPYAYPFLLVLTPFTCYVLEVPISVTCDREYLLHKMDCLSRRSGSSYPT